MAITCVRQVAWAVIWDRTQNTHAYWKNIDVAFSEESISYVGTRYKGHADTEIDGAELMLMPGLINLHCHPSTQPLLRGFTEEFGNPRLFYSNRHIFRQSFHPDEEAMLASAEYALCELMAGGVTTIVDLSHSFPGWLDLLARSGIRACVAPMYRSAQWYTDTGQETKYEWDVQAGLEAFEEAIAIMDQADRDPCRRLFSMVAPAQVDTCTEDLLRKSVCLARDTRRPLHIHAAQSYAEFQGMTRRHDMTPIEWLRSLGFLGPQTVIGHAVFTDEHPWLHWPTRNDLKLLSESNTSVAHSPTVFARDGTLMHNLGRYDRVGINIGIGTDTHPHNLIEEMRMAEILARVASGPAHSLTTSRIFDFATTSGAQALLREDIGRISEGSQADLVLVDLKHPAMQPLYDPLRSLIYSAADRAILHTFIAGQHIVANGEVLTLDREKGAVRLGEAQKRTAARVGRHDANGRQIEEIVSTTFPTIH